MNKLMMAAVVAVALISQAVAGEAFLQPSNQTQQQELIFVQKGFVEAPTLTSRMFDPAPLAEPVAKFDPAWRALPDNLAPIVAKE